MGSNGLNPVEALRERDKCKAHPTKRQYHDSKEAWKAAGLSSQRAGQEIIAYACPDCGFYHLSRKVSGSDVVLIGENGNITTPSLLSKTPSIGVKVPDRVEIEPEGPVIPANRDARIKLLREYLEGETEVVMKDIVALLGVRAETASPLMKELGWATKGGRVATWKPVGEDVNPVVHIVPPPKPALEQSIERHPASQSKWRVVDLHPIPPEMTVLDLMSIYKSAGLKMQIQVSEA